MPLKLRYLVYVAHELALGAPGSAWGSRRADSGLGTWNKAWPQLCEELLVDGGPCPLPRQTRGWVRPARGSDTGHGQTGPPLELVAGVGSAWGSLEPDGQRVQVGEVSRLAGRRLPR